MKDAHAKKETQIRTNASSNRSHTLGGYFNRLIPVNNISSAFMTISLKEAERIIKEGYEIAKSGEGSNVHIYTSDPEKKTYWLIGYGQYKKEQHSQTSKNPQS